MMRIGILMLVGVVGFALGARATRPVVRESRGRRLVRHARQRRR